MNSVSDLTAASDANDLMYIDLVDGERRLSLEHWLDALDPREAFVARRFVKYVLQTLADDKARPAERFEARRELYRRLIAAGIVD